MKMTVIAAAIALSGCAAFPQFKQAEKHALLSYVAPEVTMMEAEAVALDMARFLALQLPAARTTIELDPAHSMFHELLVDELLAKGFGVIESGAETDSDPVHVRYFVTVLDNGIVVRMRYQGKMAGRYFSRGDSGLSFASAYAVREAVQ